MRRAGEKLGHRCGDPESYMGFDSVEPFLKYPGKGVLLGVTSTPGPPSRNARSRQWAEGVRTGW